MPLLHLLAGPNGSGKTTYVEDVLARNTRLPFVNADIIAAKTWPGDEAAHAYEAAAEAETERRILMQQRASFITETVFSHPSKIGLVRDASNLGYLTHLHILLVPVELSVARVTERVARGGHTVPEDKIRARYDRLWTHVTEAIHLADSATILDNSSARTPFRVAATYDHGTLVGEPAWPTWTPETLTTDLD